MKLLGFFETFLYLHIVWSSFKVLYKLKFLVFFLVHWLVWLACSKVHMMTEITDQKTGYTCSLL